MKIDNLEESAKHTICIYPGRFQPPHRGHAATYRMLAKKYGADNTFIATSNKTDGDKSPFNFYEKRALLVAAGVPANKIIQVANTYQAKEITNNYNLAETVVLYAVGEKDMGEDPRFGSFTKKDGTPAYLQKLTDNPETADKHAYLVIAPTVEFSINGKPVTSASEIRTMFRNANPAEQADIVHQMYGIDNATALEILQSKLEKQEGNEVKEEIERKLKAWLESRSPEEPAKEMPDSSYGSTAIKDIKQANKSTQDQLDQELQNQIKESISGDDMLKYLHQSHHESGENPEMEQFITDHEWGIKMMHPRELPGEDDPIYYDDPFRRIIEIDMDDVRGLMQQMRNGKKINPIIMGPDGCIIDGNHRAAAAKALNVEIQAYVPMGKSKKVDETITEPELNVPTPTPKQLAEKYRVTLQKINHAMGKGVKVEFEHTRDIDVAREIALDHLGEDLHYYEKLASINLENDEEVLDEVNLKAIQGFANDPRLENVKMGWELEMIWPDHDDDRSEDDDDEIESEPDWDADEGINHSSIGAFRSDIYNFFVGEHNGSSTVRRALDDFLSDYNDHLAEKWEELYDDEDEDVRAEVVSRMEDGNDEVTAKEEAKDDWITVNQDVMLEDYVENNLGITSMNGFMSEGPGDLNWPVWTEGEDYGYRSEKGSLTREDLKNMFINEFGDMLNQDGYRVQAIDSPHKNKRMDTWYFEPDGSLSPQERDQGGVELTTPPIPYKRSMEYLEKVFAWAKSNRAWTGTQGDTGFHMSFSLPMEQMNDVDWVKMILMGGDDRVLRDFDRWANGENGWAKSALKHIRTATANGGDINSDMMIKAIRDGLTPDAKREAMKYMSRNKYTSVHPKKPDDAPDDSPDYTYVEFRSAGGDALGQLGKVQTAALQYARAITLAADPNAERQEYAKKLYKLVAKVKADEPGLQALQQFAVGKIDKETLKFKLSKAAVARGQTPKYQPSGNLYVFKTKPGGSFGNSPAIEIIAPSLMAAIPKAQIEARNNKGTPSYYYSLAIEPGERMFRVETEKGIGPVGGEFRQEKRAGVIVLAANGAEAAETGSQLLGLPVTELRASDHTGSMDLDDLARFENARWTTKEQVEAARQEAEKAAAEKAAAGAKAYNIVTSYGERPASRFYPPATHTQFAVSPEEAVAKFLAANMIGSEFRSSYNAVPAAPATTGPATTGKPAAALQPNPAATPQPNPAAAESGTFIITYLNTSGAQHQTAFDANSVNDAAQSFIAMHPRTYTIVSVVPHQEGQREQRWRVGRIDSRGNEIRPMSIRANSAEEARQLVQPTLPDGVQITSVEPENASQNESLFGTLMDEEEEVDEVNMSPGALADFAKTDAAKRIRVGWEAEMLVPDMSGNDDDEDDEDDYDIEPNWDENRSIRFDFNWRNQIQDFWRDGDHNFSSRREIERAVEAMDEEYQEHVSAQLADYLDSEEGMAALMASIRENEAGTEDLSDEEISELDDYANFLESATDDVRDRWTSEYLSDDSNFVDWAENNSLDDMIGFSNHFDLSWPYQTPVSNRSGGRVNMESLSKEFSKFSGYPTRVGSYSTRPDDQTGVFKTDSSIKLMDLPSNYSGVEFASAYLPYDESVDMLNKFYKWAGDIGAETNASCGFHMGISIPDQNSSNVDVLKFVLFLGDNKVLKDFGRETSTWTKSTIDRMNLMSLAGGDKYEAALAAMKQGLNAAATAQIKNTALPVSSDRGGDRYMSVNYKSDYIEVRSAGGNVFEMKDKILETMNRYVRVLALAADPEAEKQEYAKKLYKLLSSSSSIKGNDDTIRYFSQYAAGTLPSTALKSFVRQTQSQRKRDREIKAATAPATGLHGAGKWELYKVLRRADDFEVYEFMAPNADQAQYKLEQWARAGGMDSEDYTVVKANQQPNQQSQDDDIDFGTWEPEPEPQRPTGPNTWSPNARIAYQLVDRTGSPIAYFTDGTRMPTNSLFYAANSDDAGRRAADLDRVHGLPMGYIVRPFNSPGGGGGGPGTPVRLQGFNRATTESFIKSSIARAVLAEEEEIVDEVVMNPSAFQAFLGTEAAAKMTMGFEAEMCVKNLDTGRQATRSTPRLPAEEEMAAVYPFDDAGKARYYEFWEQNSANARRAITYGLKRLKNRMDSWMNSHAAGEQITSDHWARFLRGGGYRNWTNMHQLNDILELAWPYGNESGGRFDREQLKQDFQNSTGFGAVIFNSYHGGDKPKDKFVFEPDSSIRPKAGDGAQELVSYAMPLPQAIDALDKMFAWANEKGYVYANGSTGFHVNVGMEGNTPDKIDTLKLLMLMGDQKILQEFGRESNTYCESMMGRVVRQLKGGYTGQSGRDELLQSIKTKTWDGLRKLASKYVNRAQSGDKFVSVNNKGKYIEFRGPGGDWMSQQAKMRNTILQVSRAYAMAADPVEGQQDYLKKVYKLLSGMDENKKDDRLQVFADWSMGKIGNEALANQLRARQGKPTQAAAQAAAQPASTNTPPARSVVDTGEYSEAILSRLPPELANAQGWILLDDDGDEVDSFTSTARGAVGIGRDQSESHPEYTYSLESENNGRTFATFSSGGRVYYDEWVVMAARQNPAAASPAAAAPTAQATQQSAGTNTWMVSHSDGHGDFMITPVTATTAAQARTIFQRNYGNQLAIYDVEPHDPDMHGDIDDEGHLQQNDEEPAVSNMWDVWFMHQDPDDEEPSEIRNRVRADSAEAAMAEWNRRHPRSPALRATPSEGMTEAKLMDVLVAEESKRSKPKKPKTIVDGALKTLISKGRSEDEAIADLKKEIDRKFYTEAEEITETLKKVNGKWALVSRQDPSKVLQYYHGAGHPSKEWISKVERRVHSFSEGVLDEEKGWYLDGVFPDGRVWIDGHIMDRSAERGFSKRELETLLRLAAMKYSDEIVDKKDFSFQIISKGLDLGAIIVKVERPDGSMLYKVKTSWYKMKPAPNKFQDIYIVESQDKTPKGPKPKVFIDMDGTIADFFGEWSKISGVDHYKDIDKNKVEDALDLIRKHPTFWTDLPLLPHAKELVKFVKENFGDYYILSKPLENDPRSATGKRAWIRAHFQDTPPVDVILTANKAAHAMSGDVANILIDDFGKYIDSWREAGGVGIKYKDTPVAHNIDRVKKTLKDYL